MSEEEWFALGEWMVVVVCIASIVLFIAGVIK